MTFESQACLQRQKGAVETPIINAILAQVSFRETIFQVLNIPLKMFGT